MTDFSAATRLIALLGDPIAHSLSPRLQNAAFRGAGVDGVYLALRCDASALAALMRGIAAAGGGGNVTVPHKERAATALDEATDAVRRTGACNTFWEEDGRLCGDNTDVAGFRAAVRQLVGGVSGARVLLLGAGGAARAALHVLLEDGADDVLVLNRSETRARALLERFGTPAHTRLAPASSHLAGERFDLVVNATSLGLHPSDPQPLDLDLVPRAGAVIDLVYAPARTAWVRAAEARGLPAADGLEMLIQQGAAAFARWWRRPAPIDIMRDAVTRVTAG